MKPIIIFKEKNKNGKYEFTENEFKDFLENAFNEGYEEGKKVNIPTITCWQDPKFTSVTSKPNPNVTLRG